MGSHFPSFSPFKGLGIVRIIGKKIHLSKLQNHTLFIYTRVSNFKVLADSPIFESVLHYEGAEQH